MIAEALTQPVGSVKLYVRELREAGLLTTGARGVNAPHMTTLDAARLVIALLATDKPSECVERVKRFGPISYSPSFKRGYQWCETIPAAEFREFFKAETLEGVLAELFDLPLRLGINEACRWYQDNVFGLRINDFSVLAELVVWRMQESRVTGERIIPFKGAVMVKGEDGQFRHVKEFTPIKGGIRTERSVAPATLSAIGIGFWSDTLHQSSETPA